MTERVVLVFNAGSSTIKFGLFARDAPRPRPLARGGVDLRRRPLLLRIEEGAQVIELPLQTATADDLQPIVAEILDWLAGHFDTPDIAAVGHRVVHGGDRFAGPAAITAQTLAAIDALVPLAPLHQPQNLRLIRAIGALRPALLQVASFDTAFHRSQSDLVRRFALPRRYFDEGVKRYGFHGLSYQFIAARLAEVAPEVAAGRVVVAHLGSGASLCALEAGVSRDTSMGFSTLDGVPMATRPGALDPGVLIHLLKSGGLSVEALEDMLYHRSGLLGVSGLSADSRDLLASAAPEAREALDLFTFRIAREVTALANTIGGLDGIVFTAGIGEHQPQIRQAVCHRLAWLGVTIDADANAGNATRIDAVASRIAVFVLPTDEEQVIAQEACHVLAGETSQR